MGKPTGKHISKLPSGNQTWLAGTFRSMTFENFPIKTSIYRVSSLPCLIIKGYHSGASNNMPEQGASHLINMPQQGALGLPFIFVLTVWCHDKFASVLPSLSLHTLLGSGSHNAERAVTKKRCHRSGCLLEVLICFDIPSIYLIHIDNGKTISHYPLVI